MLAVVELLAVLGADVYRITRASESLPVAAVTTAPATSEAEKTGGGEAGGSNVAVAVFSMAVNLILHLGCVFCARCVGRSRGGEEGGEGRGQRPRRWLSYRLAQRFT